MVFNNKAASATGEVPVPAKGAEVGLALALQAQHRDLDVLRRGTRNLADRRARTNEAIRMLKAAFADGPHFSFTSPHYAYDKVTMSVKPIQQPTPPMWLQTRDPETLQILADEGVNTGYLFFVSKDTAVPRYTEYLKRWRAAGHACSGPCGPARARRTRPIPTCSTSSRSSAGTRSIRCRPRRSRRCGRSSRRRHRRDRRGGGSAVESVVWRREGR